MLKVVTTSTFGASGTPGPAMRRVTSMPSINGIWMSMITTSGRSRAAASSAWGPSAASPTTTMSGWALSTMT
ncbi:hypothetical protein CLV70_1187 [Pseudosporangium ferrugineum]|uniref:Uncharacterized protein n=1 Tax=Pseudosporangium ferrugineum TaxID=439699 RepID=A0A2T0RLE1_9ACTN|nr:hypothetical protein CLV70_1187 [Pseudosporangium ferrugineum]